MKKYILFIFSSFFVAFNANAEFCKNANGSPTEINARLDLNKIPSTGVFENVGAWDQGKDIDVTCSCPGSDNIATYYSINMIPSLVDGGFYKLNKYIDFSADVYVAGNVLDFVRAPFTGLSNEYYASCNGNSSINTGSKGRVTLRVKKLFSGKVDINTAAMRLYASRYSSDTPTSNPGAFFAVVRLIGSLESSVSCDVVGGDQILDFKNVYTSQIKDEHTSIRKDFSLTCTSGEIADVHVFLQANTVDDNPDLIKTSHPGVGVKIEDKQGKQIKPSSSNEASDESLIDVDNSSGNRSVTLVAKPVVTGKKLDGGPFEGKATIQFLFD